VTNRTGFAKRIKNLEAKSFPRSRRVICLIEDRGVRTCRDGSPVPEDISDADLVIVRVIVDPPRYDLDGTGDIRDAD
jgi:hypothetical protein